MGDKLSSLSDNLFAMNGALALRNGYLKFYDKYTALANIKFFIDALFSTGVKRLQILNRQRDYVGLCKNKAMLDIHRKTNAILLDGIIKWSGYDYGEGYFYQSFSRLGISGLRDTSERFKLMELKKRLLGKDILEIGSNTGFLTLECASFAKACTAFDAAPHLVDIAIHAAKELNIGNVNFQKTSFEKFSSNSTFDVVLSFANHDTYDGKTEHTLKEYFEKCHNYCRDRGILLFESHHPSYESSDSLNEVCDIMSDYFTILSKKILPYSNSFLDKGRTFIVANKKKKVAF